ncbi:hypothetical protein ENBRE01_1159 [Enteropsectra breve]|nr:hypothetical protein ENBRE01_1159 [Enteropsectra breve]
MVNLFRVAFKLKLEAAFEKVGGENRTVQIDGTVIIRKKYNRGRTVPQQWLFGAIDAFNGHYILKTISGRSKATLKAVIIDCVTEKYIMYSDMWSSYMSNFSDDLDFMHDTVNHSKKFKDPVAGVHINLIENLWMLLKQPPRRKYLRRLDDIKLYLAEFYMRSKQCLFSV